MDTMYGERNGKDFFNSEEVVEVLNRYEKFRTSVENYRRSPTVDNFGQAMLNRIALDQVSPKLEIRFGQ